MRGAATCCQTPINRWRAEDIFGSQLEMDAAQGEFERLSQLCDRDSPSPTPVLAPPNQPARSPSPLAGPAAPQPVLVPTVRIRRPGIQAELNRVNTMMQHLSAARVSLLAADSADIPTPVHQHYAAVVTSAKKSISDAARGAKASKRNVGSKKRRQIAAAKSAAVAGSAAPVRKHGQETASKAASRAARGITTANHCRYWRIQPDIPGHKTACKHEAAGRACPYIHDRTYARGRRHKLQASLQDKIARSHAGCHC